MSDCQWHIVGAGSIGCLWAAHFCLGGLSPIMIVRPEKQKPTQPEQTLRFTSLEGKTFSWPVNVQSPETLQHPIRHLLVATKAQDALSAIASIADKLADDAHIVLLQNGMGSQQPIASQFPKYNIWAGSTTAGAWMKGRFDVCHAGTGATWLGSLNKASQNPLQPALTQLPTPIQFVDNIEHKLWEKLAVNCAINGLTALYNCQNGELLKNPECKHRLDKLVDEVLLVKKALSIPQSGSLHDIVYDVCRKTAQNFSSTCMDARQNKKTELGYINAFLLAEARRLKLPLPENQQLLADLAEAGVKW